MDILPRCQPPRPKRRGLIGPLPCAILWAVMVLGCGAGHPKSGLEMTGVLRTCPSSPNCVCSDAQDEVHAIAPIQITGSPEAAFEKARDIIRGWKRCQVIQFEPNFLHAECRSAILRFVDDLELVLHANRHEIAVRSASRVGYSDFGVNRRRVERLRSALIEAGVALSSSPKDSVKNQSS